MLDKLRLNLQFFAEGADGGDGGDGGVAEGVAESGEAIPAFIPEKARETYRKAMKATKAQEPTIEEVQEATKEEPKAHIPFADLIKSDEYKEEHKAYMDKTISDRLKKYKGLEEQSGQMKDTLAKVAVKYGIDPEAEDFLEQISKSVSDDDAYLESYAIEHDLSTEEARKSLDMQRRLKSLEEEKRMREEQEAQNEQIRLLMASAEKTKAVYPDFNLDVEMQNERFRNICAVTQGDTMAAYQAVHFAELSQKQGLAVAQQAQQQVVNSVAANKSRPIENGLSSQATAIIKPTFNGVGLKGIREAAAYYRLHPEALK